MNDTKVNLVASTLTNSLGTTVMGHAAPAAIITVTYPNGKEDTLVSDPNGEFMAKAPAGLLEGDIIVTGKMPGDASSEEKVTLTIELPAPVVTAVISTQGDKRLLEGRVNQADVDVTVKLHGADEIFLLVDKSLEFELELPTDTVPSQVEVRAKSRRSGKDGQAIVTMGVTTKTLAMPALTDDMIAEYVAQEKAAKEANEAAAAAIEANDQPKPFEPAAETTPVDIPEEASAVADDSRLLRQHEKSSGLFGFFSKLFGK